MPVEPINQLDLAQVKIDCATFEKLAFIDVVEHVPDHVGLAEVLVAPKTNLFLILVQSCLKQLRESHFITSDVIY